MDKETDELYNLVKESDATDLGVLISAKESAKRRLLDESTAANQEAFHKASRYLKEYLRGDEKPAVVYPNKLAALKELQRRGFKIGKSKFYNHCKAGICKTQNKKITEEALEAYIRDPRANLKDIDSKEGERVAREKAEAERDRAQLQVKMLQHELEVKQKEFLPRSEVHREWCGRWYAVKMGVENMEIGRAHV